MTSTSTSTSTSSSGAALCVHTWPGLANTNIRGSLFSEQSGSTAVASMTSRLHSPAARNKVREKARTFK